MSARNDVIMHLGEEPSMLDAHRLVKPPGLRGVEPPAIFHFQKKRAALVVTEATDEEAAVKLGERLQKNLVSKRALTASDPYIHHIPLYVTYGGGYGSGYVELPGLEEAGPRDTEKLDARRLLLRKGQGELGAKGIRLAGHEGAYTMEVVPYAKKWRGKFATTRFTGATWEELDAKLDMVFEKLGVS